MATEVETCVELPQPTVLRGVTYGTCVKLCKTPENDGLRMTYYGGTLEIMSPESIHEGPSRRLATLVNVVAEAFEIPFEGAQSATFRRGVPRQKKGVGKEPDQSFDLANANRIVGLEKIRLDRDPPPDLWIEVDNRGSSKGRLPVYAALGVLEVWRYRVATRRVWFGRLVEGNYQKIEPSLNLPMLTPARVAEALDRGVGVIESAWLRTLRAWVRETFGNAAT